MAYTLQSAKNNDNSDNEDSPSPVPLYGKATGSAQNQKSGSTNKDLSDAIRRRMAKTNKQNMGTSTTKQFGY